MTWLTDPHAWIAFTTLLALELVLGIDNVVFISILAGKAHFSFAISWSTSLIGVLPSPHGTLGPWFFFRSFKWRLVMRAWFSLRSAMASKLAAVCIQ